VAKYYAVMDGHSQRELILTSWEACKKEVTGAKGVKFKSFPTKKEAEEYILAHGRPLPGGKEALVERNQKKDEEKDVVQGVEIYVDGSFELSSSRYAYGLVVVENGQEIHSACGAERGPFSSMRNVAGEVQGAMKAMTYALEKGFDHLILYFDYQGIESWALGTWKRNNALTQGYHEFYQSIQKDLKVSFRKVKGHSGDVFNDRADALAKEAFLKNTP